MHNLRKRTLKEKIEKGSIKSERKEKQVGTNCEWFLVNFEKKWNRVRYFMKKTFLMWVKVEEAEKDYEILKTKFKNLIPNTVFIKTKYWEVFSFSEPVVIDFDVLETKNKDFLILLLKNENFWKKLLKQLKFFIRKFRELEAQWNILDLYWKENLVFTKSWKIKYIDNYEVFWKTKLVIEKSLIAIQYLEKIIKEFD